MKRDPFACSDALADLRARFAAHRGGPVQLSADGVAWLLNRLDEVLALARASENEISRLKWNRCGAPDPDRVAAALSAAGSNVVPLVRERPFTDGRPDGGGRAA